MTSRPIDQVAVDEAHARLTTPPDGPFTRLLVVQRRGAATTDTVRGCTWTHVEAGVSTATELATYDAWRSAIADGLGLSLTGVGEDELGELYADQRHKHGAWVAAGRP